MPVGKRKQTGAPAGMVDAAAISAVFGLNSPVIGVWYRKGKIPPPAMRVGRKLFWSESVIPMLEEQFKNSVNVHHSIKGGAV